MRSGEHVPPHRPDHVEPTAVVAGLEVAHQLHRAGKGADLGHAAPDGDLRSARSLVIPFLAERIAYALRLRDGVAHAEPDRQGIAILWMHRAGGVVLVRADARVPQP